MIDLRVDYYFGYYLWNGMLMCQKWDNEVPQKYEFIHAVRILPSEVNKSLDELKARYQCPRQLIDKAAELSPKD